MDDRAQIAMVIDQPTDRSLIRHIQVVEPESVMDPQSLQPSLFEPNIVIGVEAVQADHGLTASGDRLGAWVTDKSGASGYQDPHGIGLATRRSSSNSSTAW